MGAWGVGTFENDTACDFAAEVAGRLNLSKIECALDRVLNAVESYVEAPDGEEALAAAEIVARLNNRPGAKTAYTEQIDLWVGRMKTVPPAALIDKARRGATRIVLPPSELLELWEESGDFDTWKASVNELLSRL